MLGLVAEGYKIDLDNNAHQAKAPQGQEAEESKIDWGNTTPQVQVLQIRTPRKSGASATGETTLPQAAPRTTRIERRDIGNLRTDAGTMRTRIFPFLGVAKRLMLSRDA